MKRKFRKIVIACVIIFLPVSAVFAEPVDYQLYDRILKEYVDDKGLVDYKKLKADPDNLNMFIEQVAEAELDHLKPDELKAFWINAYNAITLKVVADAYPVRSIRNINFFLVWEIPRRAAGKNISLGDIEHKIVRPIGDPRIHFALNCASLGCPQLPSEPFYPESINEQLDYQTRQFINNPEKVRVDRLNNILYHSEIFEWYEEDFLKIATDIKAYIQNYINESDRDYLKEHDVELKPLKYDWNLNVRK